MCRTIVAKWIDPAEEEKSPCKGERETKDEGGEDGALARRRWEGELWVRVGLIRTGGLRDTDKVCPSL